MTTDRTVAPTRSTALADRPAAAGRTSAPPSDAFSALLGAASPKHEAAPRREERPVRRDDSPRWDDGPRQLERRPQPPKHDEYRKRPANAAADAPAKDAIDTSCDPETPADAPAVPTTPPLFALQLASPLPPAPAGVAVTPAGTATTPSAEGEAPALPILSGIVPASVASATASAPVTGEVAADPAATAAVVPVAAVAASALANATTGVATSDEATEGAFTLPENLVKPPTAGAAQATPAAQAQGAVATAGQPQTGADAETSGQPNTPSPVATVAANPSAKPAADVPAEFAPVAQTAASTPTTTPVAPLMSAANALPNVERAVPLSRAVATTGTLIHLASERGITHARLNLKPVELGGIEVRLQSTPAGIHAQLVADSPEAARMLSQAADQLRQQLSDRDVNLLSLDVSTSSDQRNDQPGFSTDGFGENYRPGGSEAARGGHEDTVLMETPAGADTVLVLPDGVHVDVLA